MKLACVTPRYGVEVHGGAETAARNLSERLVGVDGWSVEVLTTCAIEADTWEDAYDPGDTEIDGVRVRRFTARGRAPDFDDYGEALMRHPQVATPGQERRWLEMQGPVSPELIAAIADSDADLVAFHPYLYHPTVEGIRRVASRSVLHPAAHDEAPIRLPVFAETFGVAAGMVFWTPGEQRLVHRQFAVGTTPQLVLGIGVEPGPGDPEVVREALGLGDRPYLVCLGRVDEGKGSRLLATFFAAYKERHPGPLALVFVGPVVDAPEPHPDIVLAGGVDEETKWGALRGALALVSPSPLESFSIVLLEGWAAGRPALVNGACEATRDHCARSGGGLVFDGYGTFEVAIERFEADAALRGRLAARGRAYVADRYEWPRLIERYRAFLEQVAARALV